MGRRSDSNPFGMLKRAHGDSLPTGMGSLPLFEVATLRNGSPWLIGMDAAQEYKRA